MVLTGTTRFRARVSGFTLAESLIFMVLLCMLITSVFTVSVQAGRLAKKVEVASSNSLKMRTSFERVMADVKSSDRILSQFPPTGTPIYTTNEIDTIILRQPEVDTNANIIANSYGVVIYRFQQTGASQEDVDTTHVYELRRFRSTITDGVAGPVVADGVMIDNVVQFRMAYSVKELFRGDSGTTDFYLKSTPLSPDSSTINRVLLGGQDAVAASMATLESNRISFIRPPRSGVPIDVLYRVDPSASVDSDGAIPANLANLKLRVRLRWTSASGEPQSRVIELNSRAVLRS